MRISNEAPLCTLLGVSSWFGAVIPGTLEMLKELLAHNLTTAPL